MTSAAAALTAAGVLGVLGDDLWIAALMLMEGCWSVPQVRFDDVGLSARTFPHVTELLTLLAVIIGTPALAAALISALQSGFRVGLRLPAPRWSQFGPGAGWRRLWRSAGLVPCGGLCLKLATAGLITGWMLRGDLSGSDLSDPASTAAAIGGAIVSLGLFVTAITAVVAIGDWIHRRAVFARSLRMTPDEARAEARNSTPSRRARTVRRERVSLSRPATGMALAEQQQVATAGLLSLDPLNP